jgi:hypothetical protein
MGVPGRGGGQTKPVGQYSLHGRAILAYYKINGTNSVNFVGNMLFLKAQFHDEQNANDFARKHTCAKSFSRSDFHSREKISQNTSI